MSDTFSATGRRKTSTARVVIKPGSGKITINKRPFEEYFATLSMQNRILHPLQVTNSMNQYDATITVNGGGTNGQIGACQLGIARALLKTNEELKADLREVGLLTRDARKKERKKPGQPKARKRFQFSKR